MKTAASNPMPPFFYGEMTMSIKKRDFLLAGAGVVTAGEDESWDEVAT